MNRNRTSRISHPSNLTSSSKTFTRRDFLRFGAIGLADVTLAGLLTFGDYYYCYKIPRAFAQSDLTTQESYSSVSASSWHDKFSEQFSDTIHSDATSYTSPHISVRTTQYNYDSGKLDTTADGKHTQYGTRIVYTLADIYIDSIDCFKTEFAQSTFGIGYSELLSDMSSRMSSVIAINGDSYSNNRHQQNGTIIRNGKVYRTAAATDETCVLYRDGTISSFLPEELDPESLVSQGAWQTWVFGPSLLDSNGRAKSSFFTWSYIRQSHPRTALGYFEPGHYCFLVADGRQKNCRGLFLEEMATIFEQLGCKAAYNLDGGYSASMTRSSKVITNPYSPNKCVSDGIFICEPDAHYQKAVPSFTPDTSLEQPLTTATSFTS